MLGSVQIKNNYEIFDFKEFTTQSGNQNLNTHTQTDHDFKCLQAWEEKLKKINFLEGPWSPAPWHSLRVTQASFQLPATYRNEHPDLPDPIWLQWKWKPRFLKNL